MVDRTERYVFLDGLRGIAAIVVLFGHLSLFFSMPADYAYILAVDFFFMLSGFVIARAYVPRLLQGMSLWTFTRARLIRLYPMLLVGSLLGAAALAAHVVLYQDIEWWRVGVAVGLGVLVLPNFWLGFGESAFPLNSPAWTLFFEIWANLLFALVAVVAGRWWRRAFLVIAATAFVVAMANAIFAGDTGGYMISNFAGGIPRVLFPFFIGALLHEIPRAKRSGAGVGMALVCGLLFALFAPMGMNAVGSVLIVALLFPPLIYMSSGVQLRGRLASTCTFLGEISYPLYLLHFPVLTFMAFLTSRLDPAGQFLGISITASLIVCVATSYAALKWLDEPIRRVLSQRVSRSKSIPVAG